MAAGALNDHGTAGRRKIDPRVQEWEFTTMGTKDTKREWEKKKRISLAPSFRWGDGYVGKAKPPQTVSSAAVGLLKWCRRGESNPHEVSLGGF